MKTTTARWTIALAAATIFAMPASGLAQQTPPPSEPPSASQPATPPAQTPQAPAPQSSASSDVAKTHLTNARNALSQITQLPAAAQLQGEARTQVSQLINNFNELITTQTDWKSSYAKVESNLNVLLAPQAQAAPNAAASAAGTEIDPAIRAKLVEFKGHLAKFEQAAGVASPTEAPAQTPPDPTTPTQTPPPTTPNPPANQPTSQTPPTTQTPPPTQPPTEPTQPPARPDPEPPDEPAAADPQEILAHIDAIEAILNGQATAQSSARATAGGAAGTAVGTTGTTPGSTRPTAAPGDVMLTRAQIEDLNTHLAALRRLMERK
jgi:hypothetical protein